MLVAKIPLLYIALSCSLCFPLSMPYRARHGTISRLACPSPIWQFPTGGPPVKWLMVNATLACLEVKVWGIQSLRYEASTAPSGTMAVL